MKIEVILGRLFLSVVSIIAVFILADYTSLWFLPNSRSPIEREYNVGELRKPKPYVMFGGTPNADYFAAKGEKLNNLGYRGKEPLQDKSEGEYRIFILGGSTVLFGSPSIAILLEEEFRRRGFNNVNVYNYGVISSVSGMELSRLLFEVSDMKPDLIIMYNGGNDIMQPFTYDPRPGYPFNFIAYDSNPLIESDIRTYPKWTLFSYGSNIIRYLFPDYFVEKFVPIERIRNEVKIGSKEWTESIAKIYAGNLVKANMISHSFGAQFIGFFQPIVYFKEPLSNEENAMVRYFGGNAVFLYLRELIRSELATAKLNSSPKLEVIDISDLFDGTSDRVFNDPIHIRQQSYSVVANEIYKYVAKYPEAINSKHTNKR